MGYPLDIISLRVIVRVGVECYILTECLKAHGLAQFAANSADVSFHERSEALCSPR